MSDQITDIGAALRAKKKRLGEELVDKGLVTEDQR